MRDTTKELELEQLPGISELTVFDRFKNAKVGAIPLPTYLVMSAIIIASAYLGELPVNMLGGFAVILSLGWLLGRDRRKHPGIEEFRGIGHPVADGAIDHGIHECIQPKYAGCSEHADEGSELPVFLHRLSCLRKHSGDAPQDSGARLDPDDHPDGSGDDRCIDRRNFSRNFVGIGF